MPVIKHGVTRCLPWSQVPQGGHSQLRPCLRRAQSSHPNMSGASQDKQSQFQPSAPPAIQPEPNSQVQNYPQEQYYPPTPYTPPPNTQQPHRPPPTQEVVEYRPTPTVVAAEKTSVVVVHKDVVKEKCRSCPERKRRLGLRLALGLATGGSTIPLMMFRRHRRRQHHHD